MTKALIYQKVWGARKFESTHTLSLYCDTINDQHDSNEFPHHFNGHSYHDCKTQAMMFGWVIHRATRTTTCPKCTKRYGVKQRKSAITRMSQKVERGKS